MSHISEIIEQAREASWNRHGKRITFYLPGMFSCNGTSGKYPALSVTGSECALQCEHCRAKILSPMTQVTEPDLLVKRCVQLEKNGNLGVLISGGCDEEGRLPWGKFIPALHEVKIKTGLKVSIHSGFVDDATALRLRGAGVDQVLIDIIGDDETYRRIYHLDSGVARLIASLEALESARLSIVPHIVCGIFDGKIRAEMEAIDIVSKFHTELLVMVSLMRVPDTPMWGVDPPPAEAVAELIARARLKMPGPQISLGCARQRGDNAIEVLAIDAGINRLALPSEAAVNRARYYGMEVKYQKTCCSVCECIPESDWRVS
jgi:uncharacterized radical SAM superfamily protein